MMDAEGKYKLIQEFKNKETLTLSEAIRLDAILGLVQDEYLRDFIEDENIPFLSGFAHAELHKRQF